MNPNFALIIHRGLQLLVFEPWWNAGLVHGMTTTQLAGSFISISESARIVCEALDVHHLALPLQCHGCDVVDLRSASRCEQMLQQHGDLMRRETGDAILAPEKQALNGVTTGFGIATADCVPILVRGQTGFALIHAGWRGLANGVISRALQKLGGAREAVVFGCAGGQRYEVGLEVLEAIGPSSVATPSHEREGAWLLDTALTAIRQLREECPTIQAVGAEVCTIDDTRFHSFRRDGEKAGRALTFVIPGAP
jgi:copper oxidase (laccase) domain-containing protein